MESISWPTCHLARFTTGSAVFMLLALLGSAVDDVADVADVDLEDLLRAGVSQEDCIGDLCSVSLLQTSALVRREVRRHDTSGGSTRIPSTGMVSEGDTAQSVHSQRRPDSPATEAPIPARSARSRSSLDALGPMLLQLGATEGTEGNSTLATGPSHTAGYGRNASAVGTTLPPSVDHRHNESTANVSGSSGPRDAYATSSNQSARAASSQPTAAEAQRESIAVELAQDTVPTWGGLDDSSVVMVTGAAAVGNGTVPGGGPHSQQAAAPGHHATALAVLLVVLLVLLGIATAVLGRALHVGARVQALAGWRWQASDVLRGRVEALRRCPAAEVERQLPATGGYDCALSKPLSSGRPLRLEARVEGPLLGGALAAPLSQRACVHHSATVSRQAREGAPLSAVASASESLGFAVSLLDAPHTRIEVCGSDLCLFDMHEGRFSERRPFAAAPEHWQDFALFNGMVPPGNEGQASWLLHQDGPALEFQEHALLVGSNITLVGELLRDASGKLSLQPWQDDGFKASGEAPALQESWRTSWERGGGDVASAQGLPSLSGASQERPQAKVLVSDDPSLLDSSAVSDGSPPGHGAACGVWSAVRKAARAAATAMQAAGLAASRRLARQAQTEERTSEDTLPPMYV